MPVEEVVEEAGFWGGGVSEGAASWPSSQALNRPDQPPEPSSGWMDLQKVVRIWSAATPDRQQVAGASTSISLTYTVDYSIYSKLYYIQ